MQPLLFIFIFRLEAQLGKIKIKTGTELAKNRTHSDETKALISRALTGENNPFYNKNHSVESKLRMIEANSAYPVYVLIESYK